MKLARFENTLFEEFTKDFKSRTITDYKRELIAFKNYIGKSVLEANEDDAQRYIKGELTNKAATTKLRIYHQLYGFYQFLLDNSSSDNKIVKENPFQKVTRPKASKQVKKERVLDFDDIIKLFSVLKNKFEIRDYAIVVLLATTGLRINEALNIKWNDFICDKEDKVYIGVKRIHEGKSKIDYIYILEKVWQIINQYKGRYLKVKDEYLRSSNYIFINATNLSEYRKSIDNEVKPITADYVRKMLVKACTLANVPIATPKDLRHAHAMYTLKLGASLDEVKNQLGWNNKNLVYRYSGVIEQLTDPANIYTEDFFNKVFKNI